MIDKECPFCGSELWQSAGAIAQLGKRKITASPCTPSCWHATGDDCSCSCGGRYHGLWHDPAQRQFYLKLEKEYKRVGSIAALAAPNTQLVRCHSCKRLSERASYPTIVKRSA